MDRPPIHWNDSLTLMIQCLLSTGKVAVDEEVVGATRLAKLVLSMPALHDALGLADDVQIVAVSADQDTVRILVTADWFNDNGRQVPRVALEYLR